MRSPWKITISSLLVDRVDMHTFFPDASDECVDGGTGHHVIAAVMLPAKGRIHPGCGILGFGRESPEI